MAFSAGAISATNIAFDGRNALDSISILSRTGSIRSLALPKGLESGPFASSRIVLSFEDVTSALALAITAGNGILGALRSLKSAFAVANHDSLVSPSTNLLIDGGTRVSRLNIQALAHRVIDQINSLVETTEFKYARLISSKGGDITLQTSAYGGSIVIISQPLDSAGLGIDVLDLLSDKGVDAAIVAINRAVALAGTRLDRLTSLRDALGKPNPFSSQLAALLSSGQSSVLPRGSLVNVVG